MWQIQATVTTVHTITIISSKYVMALIPHILFVQFL